MKKKGVRMKFHSERIDDIMKKFFRLSSSLKRAAQLSDYQEISEMPTKRFWVSEERAYFVINSMINGRQLPRMCQSRDRMYGDILSRVKSLMQTDKTIELLDACIKVINSPAPCSYLTPLTIKTLISVNRRKWIKEHKQEI